MAEQKDCEVCGGTGEVIVACITCNMTGMGPDGDPCPVCHGDTEYTQRCATCGGSGKVTR